MKRLIALIFLAVVFSTVAQIMIDSDNELIGVGADNVGMFSIGVPPDIDHPSVRLLLNYNYTLPSPAGAYAGFLIDSVLYSTNGLIHMLYPDSCVNLSDHITRTSFVDVINKWIMTEWFIDDDPHGADSIYIQQVLQPQESGGSGTVVMRWLVRNTGSEPHTIGLVLAMDTKIGTSDSAKIWAPGIPYSNEPKVLPDAIHGWDLPAFWEAYEYDPPFDTLGLVARGILGTPPNTMPDKIAMADWRDLLGLYWDFDLAASEPYDDSGVMLWWYPVTVQPGSLTTFTTTYGLSDSSENIGGIYGLSISYPRDQVVAGCNLVPNPFNLIVSVTNNSDSTVENMTGVFDDSGADHLTLAPGDSATKLTNPSTLAPGQVGFVSWRVMTDPAPLTSTTDYFQVTALTLDPDTFTTSPPMPINIRGSDYMGPLTELVEPLYNTITSDSLQPIKIYIHDEDVGVNPNRLFFYFYPTIADTIGVDITDPRLTFVNDTLCFQPTSPMANGNVIRFQLTRAEDWNGCPSDPMDISLFRVDLDGPIITGHFPPDGSIQTDSLIENYVLAYDVYGDLRIQSVDYLFGLDDYPAGASISGADADDGVSIGLTSVAGESDTVYWKPAEWTSGVGRIADGYVDVSLNDLTDDPDYGIPNPCLDTPYEWSYIMNSHGPRARPIVPAHGDYVSVPHTNIMYYLYDGNSIDMSTAVLSLDGAPMPVTGGPRDSIRTFVVDTVFEDCYMVVVSIDTCYDSLGTPLDPSGWTWWSYFTDYSAPFITSSSLEDGDTIGTDIFDFEVSFDDICSGIERDSILVMVDGELITLLTWVSDDELTFEVNALNDSVIIDIRLCDRINVGPANWLDTTYVIQIQMEGPRAHFMYSETGYICSATGPIVWHLQDLDGINESTIIVSVDGDTYTIADSELEYDASTNLLTYTPSTPWLDGQLVSASLDEAEDIYGYTLSAPVTGLWNVDLDGIVWMETIDEAHVSTGGSSYDMLDSFLTIHFEWGDGEVDSVMLIFEDDTFYVGLGLTMDDTMITFDAADAGIILDSAVTYEMEIFGKSICAFSLGDWYSHTVSLYSTNIDEYNSKLPDRVQLLPNRPDPFNAATTIPFVLPKEGNVRLEIVDILGRHVSTLIDNRMNAGGHEIVWHGRDDSGREMPSGVYNCRIIVGDDAKSQRITLVR